MDTTPIAPIARKEPHEITQLGHSRIDDYAWMKDENWQEVLRDPSLLRADIADYLRAENTYADAVLAPTTALQAEIVAEMKARLREDESWPTLPHGPWRYGARYEAGAQHPRHFRHRAGHPDQEEVLLDVEARAKDHAFYSVGGTSHSGDHRLFAWGEDTQGSEIYRVRIIEIATGKEIGAPIENCSGNFIFSPDSQQIFWTFRDDNGRPTKVFRRMLLTGKDSLVYEEPDPGFFVAVSGTRSGQWIVVSSHDHDTSESWLIPGNTPAAAARCMARREKGVLYEPLHWGDRFVIRTNAGGATDFKLMTVPDSVFAALPADMAQATALKPAAESTPDGTEAALADRATWQEHVPHRPGHYITDAICFARHLVWIERHDANLVIVIEDQAGEQHVLATDEEAYTLSLDGALEFETTALRYSYQSPTTPRQWYEYDMQSRARHLLKAQEIPSGHDPQHYRCRRLFARAADGEMVPITLLSHRDTPENVPAPLLLYGYGSYGHAIEASFSTRTLSLVDRGFVYAIAHVRGGSEKGWNWFLGGRGPTKPNTFTDFIACAEHLIEQGFTDAGQIVADGRSAGGMLMGAITNLRPDLFAGIVAVVPFVDVLNTMSDESLPLTPPEWPEWGNPLIDPEAYALIAGYSPYDRIKPDAYPAVLAIGGLTDPRVTYWEPAKWIAKLRENTTSDRPLLLRINMESGHGGASGRFKSLDEAALIHAFAIAAVGGDGSKITRD